MSNSSIPQVYSAISAVMAHMAGEGIGKGRVNEQQKYRFRGIDDIYNSLSRVLADNKLVMLPFVQTMEREERHTKSGGVLNYTILTVDFKIVSAEDGTSDTIRMVGEAMDSADKSSNKAMSAALKYAALQVFMIPTEGDNDADATTHEVAPRKPREVLAGPITSKTALWAAARAFDRELRGCGDVDQLDQFVALPDSQALLNQLDRDAPNVARTGEGLPDEFEPIIPLMARLRSNMLAAEANGTPYEPGILDAG